MNKQIIIDVHSWETRAALLEDGKVAELFFDRQTERGVGGAIFLGKVIRVLPGMQAAFIDIGLERAAFLYLSETIEALDELLDGGTGMKAPLPGSSAKGKGEIALHLKRGKDVLVQVTREPISAKGARLTSHISLPGRSLVLLPTIDRIGISRRIEDEKERRRLREIIGEIKPDGMGLIVRTEGWGAEKDDFIRDRDGLLALYREIIKSREATRAPALIHQELDLPLRLARDLLNGEIERLEVNSPSEFSRISGFVALFMPELKRKVVLYKGETPLFTHYGVEAEIDRLLQRRVWLKSGGYIIIEETEALTVIDVNTGKFVGKKSLEDTILKTNLEAVSEIAKQLRLRNIGGIIIIDFIDMEQTRNREAVFSALEEATKRDRKRTNILKISELGIVEMTRKRTGENTAQILTEPCPFCAGNGHIKSKRSVAFKIFQEISGEKLDNGTKTIVTVHPEVAAILYGDLRQEVEGLEQSLGIGIVIRPSENMREDQYTITYRQ